MICLKKLSSKEHQLKLAFDKPIPTLSDDLNNFIFGLGTYDNNSEFPGYRHCVTEYTDTSSICHMPRLDYNHVNRSFEYMSQYEMWPAFELNIKRNYHLYIKRFINHIMGKKDLEDLMKENWTEVLPDSLQHVNYMQRQRFLSFLRFRLKIVKDFMTGGERNELINYLQNFGNSDHPSNVYFLQEVIKYFDDSTTDVVFETTNYLIEEGVTLLLEHWLSIIFPNIIQINEGNGTENVQVKILQYTLEKYPLHFLKPSFQIIQYLEGIEAKLFNVIPLNMGSKPGYFPIDTRTLWGIGKNAMGNLDGKPRFKQVQNYMLTNGISICFQFVREDLAGLTFKPDSNIAKVSVSYFDHLDPGDYSDQNVVFGDLGKRDLIQFGAQSEESNSNPLKKYEWMRLTYGEWSRLNRKHEQVLQFCVRQNNGNSEDQTMTIQEWNSWLRDHDSKTVDYHKFREFMLAKCKHYNAVKQFYSLPLWRIHNIQSYIHRQKTEERIVNKLLTTFGGKDKMVLCIGDLGRKPISNLKHSPPTPSNRWISCFLRRGFQTVLIDESHTSSKCPSCIEKVFETTIKTRNPIPKSAEKTPFKSPHGLLECRSSQCINDAKARCKKSESREAVKAKYWNRNKMACLNMLNVFDHWLSGEEGRPVYLRT
ncbi:hypothetical protein P9112_010910 [Eukaryota sp. TZLM1-RC]